MGLETTLCFAAHGSQFPKMSSEFFFHSVVHFTFGNFNTSSPFFLTEFCQTLLRDELLCRCSVLHFLASCVHVENSRDRD